MSNALVWREYGIYYYFHNPISTTNYIDKVIYKIRLGDEFHIINLLKTYSLSQSFSRRRILREPARWAAYFLFLKNKNYIPETSEVFILKELFNSIESNIWVQNRDVVSLLLESLKKYSVKL